MTPDNVGWDDWWIVGTVRGITNAYPKFVPLSAFLGNVAISEMIAHGADRGVVNFDGLRIEWCRSTLNGPADRVSDWLEAIPPNRRRKV